MKNYKLNSIAGYASALMILLAAASSYASLDNMKTFDGHPIIIESGKVTHLIFQEIWSSYEGLGEEARIAALPKDFTDTSQQIWVQPGINVTAAQLTEYQGYYPQVKPLVLDRGYQLMRSFGEWELPLHVIIKDGKKVFSGNGDELTQWLQLDIGDRAVKVAGSTKAKPASFAIKQAAKPRFHKPEKGDQAPVFTATTMAGETVSLLGLSYSKPLSLVFLDSLCPMPHFPGCEAQIEQLSNLVKNDDSRQWLGVVSSFYVNEEVVKQFRKKFQLKLPLIFDVDNQIYRSYGVHASPYQIDINREGNIRSRGSDIH
ncbi:MAG: redoxin domain-containing protein [Oleispira sp.]|nr:redoxin domain-containing protein [Oleispira sp.]